MINVIYIYISGRYLFLPILLTYIIYAALIFCFLYLANAVMAFSNYHEKFRQIGTNPDSYESWVNSEALLSGLKRLKNVMKLITSSSSNSDNNDGGNGTGTGTGGTALDGSCSFERELSVDFAENDCIKEANNGRTVVGVCGVCDWINEDLMRCIKKDQGVVHNVDLLEIKFVHQLSHVHRLQVLVYCALYVLELNSEKKKYDGEDDENERTEQIECCRGMLYNACTGETEICSIQASDAMDFLLDISQFKYNGKDRNDIQQESKSIVPKTEIKNEDSATAATQLEYNGKDRQKDKKIVPKTDIKTEALSATICSAPSSHRLKRPKKRLQHKTGNSYYTAFGVDDDDNDDDSPRDFTGSRSPRSYRLKKKPKNSPIESSQLSTESGTDSDPIILD